MTTYGINTEYMSRRFQNTVFHLQMPSSSPESVQTDCLPVISNVRNNHNFHWLSTAVPIRINTILEQSGPAIVTHISITENHTSAF
jgi:hypothetical protein